MEASDVFTGNEIGDQEDPFAGTDFGDFEQQPVEPAAVPEERPVPEADAPIATEGLPTVDREGNPVVAAEAHPVEKPAAQVGPTPEAQSALDAVKATAPAPVAETHMQAGATVEEAPAVAAPAPASAPETTPPVAPDPPAAQNGAQTAVEPSVQLQAQAALDAVKAEAAAEAAAAPQPTPVIPEEGPGVREPEPKSDVPVAEPDPTPAASAVDESATSAAAPAESAGQTEADDGEITPPEEKKDKNDRVTHRRYLILRVDGNGKYTEVTWYEKGGSIVAKGTTGAKRQKYALARGQEDALKVGYAALGSPPKAHIVAVALSSFQPKVVEPEAPKPERARLKIS